MTARDTARDQARRRTAGRPDAPRTVLSEPVPGLPERLIAARERKGVDLYRAERDTKIRARYLAALERGDYRELPGAVYTKGFLRNYALYLGLDPDDVLAQFHAERGEAITSEPVIVVPRPIIAPRKGFTFTPGVVAAALLTVGVIAFAAYLGVQLLRFAKPPTISVTDPATAVSQVDETTTTYTLRGTSIAGATITVTTPGRDPIRATAAPDGTWSVDVELRRGKNQFDVTATDPDTGKQAEDPRTVFITVPFSVVQAPSLTVDQPADGATFENGAIPVQGTATNATTVVVGATWLGPAGGTTTATTSPTTAPGPTVKPGPTAKPGASPATASPPAPQPQTVPVADDGTFGVPFELTAGRWSITVTASSAEAKTVSISRTVTVQYKGVNLVVSVKGGKAWLKAWVDGQVDPSLGTAGKVVSEGKTLTFMGQSSVEVRTGSSGFTYFTLNGTSLGALGKPGVPETWLFAPPAAPSQTQHR